MEGQVQHEYEGLLDTILAVTLHQDVAEGGDTKAFEDLREQLRLQLADVAQGNGCGDSDTLVPLKVRLKALILGLESLAGRVHPVVRRIGFGLIGSSLSHVLSPSFLLHGEYGQDLLQGSRCGEAAPCGLALGTDVL